MSKECAASTMMTENEEAVSVASSNGVPVDKEGSNAENVASPLEAAAEEQRRPQDEILSIQAQSATSSPSAICSKANKCTFLDEFPIEVCNLIYEHMLVNPLLGELPAETEIWSRSEDWDLNRPEHVYGQSTTWNSYPWPLKAYGLKPHVLRICRQISVEASRILYDSNSFAFNATTMSCPLLEPPPVIQKVFERERKDKFEHERQKFVQRNIKSVRQWIIHLDRGYVGEASKLTDLDGNALLQRVHPVLFDFCRSLHSSQLNSVTLVISWPFSTANGNVSLLNVVPAPFHTLRHVGKFDVQTPTGKSIITPATQPFNGHCASGLEELIALKDLIEGDTPRDESIEMAKLLLDYACCFERKYASGLSKAKEEPIWGEDSGEEKQFRDAYMLPLLGYKIIDPIRMGDVWGETKYMKMEGPFQQYGHPVEVACAVAHAAGGEHNVQVVKEQRDIVLEYLEPQYQRIMKAFWALTEFVKTEKVPTGLLDVNIHVPKYNAFSTKQECHNKPGIAAFLDDLGAGLNLLDDFAVSLKRDMPLQMKAQIRLDPDPFNRAYASLPFETKLRTLSELVARLSVGSAALYITCADTANLFILLRETIQEAETIYQDIRTARKLLFSSDHTKTLGCELDIEEWRSDDRIEWGVNEPYVGMQKEHRVSVDEYGEETEYEYPWFWAGWNVDWIPPPGFVPY